MRKLFNAIAKKPKFQGDLVPLNDPVLNILRAGDVGRALLVLNDGADQRIYRSPYDDLKKDKYFKYEDGVTGVYIQDYDSIVIANRKEGSRKILLEADTLAHELAHRFQNQRQKAFPFYKKMHTPYEKTVLTVLKEMHADNIAEIVMLQAYQTYKNDLDKKEALEPDVFQGFESMGYGYKLERFKDISKITPEIAEKVFESNYALERYSAYIEWDVETEIEYSTAIKKLAKGISATTLAYGFPAIMGLGSFHTAYNDGVVLALPGLIVSALWGGLGHAFVQSAKKDTFLSGSEFDFKELFDYAAAGLVPCENDLGYIEFSKINDEDYKAGRIKSAIKQQYDMHQPVAQ